jgi:hypothetical protein
VRGWKLELERFLSHQGVDISLLSETFLNDGQAFRLANYVCHCTDRTTAGGFTVIMFRRDIVHHSVHIPGLTHLEATAIQATMADKLVKIVAAYLSPFGRQIGADLSVSFGGGLLVLMAGAKHTDWNSRLMTRRGKLLLD